MFSKLYHYRLHKAQDIVWGAGHFFQIPKKGSVPCVQHKGHSGIIYYLDYGGQCSTRTMLASLGASIKDLDHLLFLSLVSEYKFSYKALRILMSTLSTLSILSTVHECPNVPASRPGRDYRPQFPPNRKWEIMFVQKPPSSQPRGASGNRGVGTEVEIEG